MASRPEIQLTLIWYIEVPTGVPHQDGKPKAPRHLERLPPTTMAHNCSS